MNDQAILENFRTERYAHLNRLRWDLFLKTGIPLAGKTVFEPGAGVGDQTEWLLAQGVARVIVSDGREGNLDIIRRRFDGDARVSPILGNLETCLGAPEFQFEADLVFLWGVYYHINDDMKDWPILRGLARIAPIVAFDYLESARGHDYVEGYNYENPSASISHNSGRPTAATIVAGLRQTFGHAYWPVEQMKWHDPSAPLTPRRIIVGSRAPVDFPGLKPA